MTVKELIEKLQEYPQDMRTVAYNLECDCFHDLSAVVARRVDKCADGYEHGNNIDVLAFYYS
jgi:hypothetical protein